MSHLVPWGIYASEIWQVEVARGRCEGRDEFVRRVLGSPHDLKNILLIQVSSINSSTGAGFCGKIGLAREAALYLES